MSWQHAIRTGILGLQPADIGADRGEALVARRRAVVPAGAQPGDELGDRGDVDQFEGEPLRWDRTARHGNRRSAA